MGSLKDAAAKVIGRISSNRLTPYNKLTPYLFDSDMSAEDVQGLAPETGSNTAYVAGSPSGQNASIGKRYKLAGIILGATDLLCAGIYKIVVEHGMDLYYKFVPGSEAYNGLHPAQKLLRHLVSADAPKLGPITPVSAGWIALTAAWLVGLGLYLHGRDKEGEKEIRSFE